MHLNHLDWVVIGVFLVATFYLGLRQRKTGSKNLEGFFLGGRKLPWYIAGISMVATTFAADTPLWVTEVIAQHGISGNWLWWNMLIGGMLTTFFFSKLWRRSGVLTELEFIEFRYSGKAAAFLRGFKAIYMGIFLNVIVIGWVNYALISILTAFFELPQAEAQWYVIAIMMLVAIYSSISGLLGVAVTDTLQFVIAMLGCTILAILLLNHEKIGGIEGLKAQLPAWRFDFFPRIGDEGASLSDVKTYSVTLGAFLTFGLVQWWASWYPGAEPGGGGYVAQRMMSTKNEKHAIYATLFFQIAHYCIRPWPWIIVGLCALLLYPELPVTEAGKGFVFAMRDHLPQGLKGLLLVAFFAAYMSTISTQLNWGASYLTNDLYKRFIQNKKLDQENNADVGLIKKSRWFTLLIAVLAILPTLQIGSIDSAAKFLIQCGAGLGMVLILRWYWWRINAWSEIVATIAPFIGMTIATYLLELEFTDGFLLTVGFGIVCWLPVTFLTKPTDAKTLKTFYERVKPEGAWGKVKRSVGQVEPTKGNLLFLFASWLSSIAMTYALLFGVGQLIFLKWEQAFYSLIVFLLSFFTLLFSMKKTEN